MAVAQSDQDHRAGSQETERLRQTGSKRMSTGRDGLGSETLRDEFEHGGDLLARHDGSRICPSALKRGGSSKEMEVTSQMRWRS
jgi:hypothetical protein